MVRSRCFIDVSHGEVPIGRITIELFTDKTPKTCENFRQLCTGEHNGLSYAQAPFHRVIDEFMIQGGDIDKGDGTGRTSIYGAEFEDENMRWRDMEAKGLVCSANSGPDTNGSQFFVTLEPCEHLNGKHTIFGHVVGGQDTLDRLAKVKVDKDDRPLEPVLISRCGELEKRKKKQDAAPNKRRAEEASSDRGRRRSNNSDVEMQNSPEPQPPRKRDNRRQSDNQIDEGLRGRPRQRSDSGSRSREASSRSEEQSGASSPAKKHKRKRSQSPSRHKGEGTYERRRRSLPNQYQDDRAGELRDDEQRYRPSPRRDDHRHGNRRHDRYGGGDSYRPPRDRNRRDHAGRLGGDGRLGGGGGGHDDQDPPVRFKGRGVMKYREADRL